MIRNDLRSSCCNAPVKLIGFGKYTLQSERAESATLRKLVGEMVEVIEDLNGYLNAVAGKLPVGQLMTVLEKIDLSANVLAKAKLEIGEGR